MTSEYTIADMHSGIVQWNGAYSDATEAFDAFRGAAGVDWPYGSYISSIPGLHPVDPDDWPPAYVIWKGNNDEGMFHYVFVAVPEAE